MSLDFEKSDDNVNEQRNEPETVTERFQAEREADPHAAPPLEDLAAEREAEVEQVERDDNDEAVSESDPTPFH